jgi:hypothetical protein
MKLRLCKDTMPSNVTISAEEDDHHISLRKNAVKSHSLTKGNKPPKVILF